MIAIFANFKVARQTLREGGFKALFKKYGWRLFAVVFVYYLVRDLILYVFAPLLAFKLLS